MSMEKDLIKNAYYIISYFHQKGKIITQLKLQKLLYFLEAIYLIQNLDESSLFKEDFYAWEFGPVSKVIYQKFKDYRNTTISLNEEGDEIASNMNEENKVYIEALYRLLGDMTASQLVTLSHLPNSPWFKLKEKFHGNIPKDTIISRVETRDWLAEMIGIDLNGE